VRLLDINEQVTPHTYGGEPDETWISQSTTTTPILEGDPVPVKPRREPVPEWRARGYMLDGTPAEIVLVPVKVDDQIEVVMRVDDEPPIVLHVDGIAQMVANLRAAGERVGAIRRSRREPGRWQ
jgi:hypothetical protein